MKAKTKVDQSKFFNCDDLIRNTSWAENQRKGYLSVITVFVDYWLQLKLMDT